MVHVLGLVFHSLNDHSVVRVATLVDQLDSAVRIQAALFISRNKASPVSIKDEERGSEEDGSKEPTSTNRAKATKADKYAIGVGLVKLLEDRGLIHLSPDLNFDDNTPVVKKKGKSFASFQHYVMCNFDLLPIKLNLPMVCKPLDWQSPLEEPSTLSDLYGGYLSGPTGEIYQRFRLLTSRDMNHFYIKFNKTCKTEMGLGYKPMCDVMNKLQSQSFEIHKVVFNLILNNRDRLVEFFLLMPSFLASLNLKEATDLLRESYFQDQSVMKVCNFHDLLQEFMKHVQRARYETFILKLASAYDGYKFYLPAFVDSLSR